jgi:hypothetical protein
VSDPKLLNNGAAGTVGQCHWGTCFVLVKQLSERPHFVVTHLTAYPTPNLLDSEETHVRGRWGILKPLEFDKIGRRSPRTD